MGRQVPRRVVSAHHAVPHRAAEENRPLVTSAPGTDPQLLSGQKDDFQRDRGRLEQQGQSHHEKILRLSHVSGTRTGPLSLTWQVTRARVYPRFLLTTLKRDATDLTTPDNVLWTALSDEASQSMNRRQALVASCSRTLSGLFQIGQEEAHQIP